jgi:pimeloyl-ACP methyl ester carboxylesterase
MVHAILITVLAAVMAGCASEPMPRGYEVPSLPAGVASTHDLRGAYRAALCARLPTCAQVLYRFDGEAPAARPPAADPARYRLLFIPGFLASCFPAIHSFGDVVDAANAAGFDARVLDVGGRNGVVTNARLLATQLATLPDDGRRIVLIGHSKGAVEALELLVERPDVASKVAGVLTVAGALQGSPLADQLDGLYTITFGAFPFAKCDRGEGDPIFDLQPAQRAQWWLRNGPKLRVPVYSIVAVPELDRLSPTLLTPFALLSQTSRYNDGMLLARDQAAAAGNLLGIVNADHLTAGIPYPSGLPWVLLMVDVAFPRPQVVLAAIDVIAANSRE